MVQKTTGTNRTAICYNSGMKKLLLTVLAIGTITGVGYAVAQHYQEYQNKQQTQAQAEVTEQADKIAQLEGQVNQVRTELAAEVARLRSECEKGRVAYDQLSTFAKSKVAVPQCSPTVAQ